MHSITHANRYGFSEFLILEWQKWLISTQEFHLVEEFEIPFDLPLYGHFCP